MFDPAAFSSDFLIGLLHRSGRIVKRIGRALRVDRRR